MKFELYGVEFKLELAVTGDVVDISILDTVENVTVADELIYDNFDLSEYVKEKVHEYVFI